MTDDGKFRTVTNIPEDFFQIEGFQSGETEISVLASGISKRTSDRISDAVSRHEVIDITAGSGKIVSNSRKISKSLSLNMEGDFSLAVIRVSDMHAHSPDDTAAEISDYIFGTSGNSLSTVRKNMLDFISFFAKLFRCLVTDNFYDNIQYVL